MRELGLGFQLGWIRERGLIGSRDVAPPRLQKSHDSVRPWPCEDRFAKALVKAVFIKPIGVVTNVRHILRGCVVRAS